MSKLTIDDLVQAQQRNEELLKQIAASSTRTKTTMQKIVFEAAGLISIVAWLFGAYVASKGNLVGVCICMIAISARLERLLSK